MSNRQCKTVRQIQKMDEFCQSTHIKYNFWCECGKKYDNYPALYLHFKRYHKMKISTRVSDEHCKVIKTKDSRAFIYFCPQKGHQNLTLQNKKSMQFPDYTCFQTVISQFFKLEKLKNHSQLLLSCILEELLKFMKNFKQRKNMVEELPNYFNQFMETNGYFFRQMCIYQQSCLVLLELGKWLNENNYSRYIIQLNMQEQHNTPIVQCDKYN